MSVELGKFELEALVPENQFVMLAVPDEMLSGAFPGSESRFDPTFVVMGPCFDVGAEALLRMDPLQVSASESSPLPVAGPRPMIPSSLGVDPRVDRLRLRILVDPRGLTRSVVAVAAATRQAEYLVEPIVTAARAWRFGTPSHRSTAWGDYFVLDVGSETLGGAEIPGARIQR